VVAVFEGADGDVAVLPKPLILNPAGTEGQALINALMATELSIGWPETGSWEVVRSLEATPLRLALMLVGAAPVSPDADAPASIKVPGSVPKEIAA
jgi:hypothetical protein